MRNFLAHMVNLCSFLQYVIWKLHMTYGLLLPIDDKIANATSNILQKCFILESDF